MAATLTNISQWISGGFEDAQFVLSTSGRPYGSVPAQTINTGMTNIPGVRTANINLPAGEVLQIQGDDGVRGAIQFPSNALPTFDLEVADLNMAFINALQGTTTDDAQSVYDFMLLDPADRTFPDVFLLLTRKAPSTEAGSEGLGKENVIFPLCTLNFQGPSGFSTGANEGSYTFNVTVNRVSQLPWGETLTVANHGTTGASGFIFWSEQIPTFDVYVHDGADTAFTPTNTIASNNQVIAWNDITGTPATLATSISSGDFTFTAQTADDVSLFMYEKA